MLPDDSEFAKTARNNLGRRAQTGGAIAVFVGVLLLLFGPAPTSGIPLDPHKLAWLFVAIGMFLIIAGTVARWLLLD